MAIQELNRYGLWVGKETAKGSAVAAGAFVKRFIQVGGDFGTSRADGSEPYSDLSKFGNETDWVDSLVGNGAPIIEASPEELAYLLYLFHGGETVTNVTGPPAKKKHAFTPLPGAGFWASFFRRVGQNVVTRHQFDDCRFSQLVIEGSTANKAVRVTPNVLSLDPGVTKTSDPTGVPTAMPTKIPFLYTDGTGAFTIDGTVFTGESQFILTLNEDLQPVYGDDVTVYDLVEGNASVTISATVFLDSNALQEWNKLLYGAATPTAGTKPLHVLPAIGSYSFYLKARDTTGAVNGDEFKLTIPSVKWTVPDLPAPAANGGPAEVTLAGAMRFNGGATSYYEIDVNNDDVAYT